MWNIGSLSRKAVEVHEELRKKMIDVLFAEEMEMTG